jgi:phage tail P2-like protein
VTEVSGRFLDHVLPSNAFNYERVIGSQVDHLLSLGIPIEDLWNPWKCPEQFLPYLAWSLSVDLWKSDWPISKKRAVVADAIALQRLKGTEAGLARAIKIMGGEVQSVITPPNTLYLSVSYTPEEYEAWLSRMPQLRIYPNRMPSGVGGLHVGQYLGYHSYTLTSQAFFQATPRVTIWRPGQAEKDLLTLDKRLSDPTITQAEEFLQVREPRPTWGMFIGTAGPWYPQESKASEQIFTVRTRRDVTIPGTTQLAAELAGPGLEPIDVRSKPTIREGKPFVGVYGGGSILGYGLSKYLLSSQARQQVYRRIHLYDPENRINAHSGRTFLGYNFRFGQAAYTADIKVKVEQKRPPAAYSPFSYGFILNPDTTAHDDIVNAVVTHKSLRDRILVNTRTKGVITAGAMTAGEDVVAGQIISI